MLFILLVRADMRRQQQLREARKEGLVQSLRSQGIDASTDDDIHARWGWSFKVIYDSYLEEKVEADAKIKLQEMLDLAEKAQKISNEKLERMREVEARYNAIQQGLAAIVPELLEDSLIDPTCLDIYHRHLHHCPEGSSCVIALFYS